MSLFAAALLGCPLGVHADVGFPAKIVKVRDGDSVVARSGRFNYELRLGDIDAPEYNQPWGKQARRALNRRVNGRRVTVRVQDIDGYGRLVAQLDLDGSSVNRTMVADGHAWAYRDYLRDPELLKLEAAARGAGCGLWSLPSPVAPWLFRRGQTGPAETNEILSSVAAWIRGAGPGFSCGGKRYCSQMKSCTEANFYLHHCGVESLDGDDDGKACERLCAARR